MTSPVDTSVKFYGSFMDGTAWPVVSGAAGSWITMMDALIAGFDSKSVTITVTGGVATVAWTGLHSCFTDTVVLVAGATGAWTALNGEQKITSKVAGAATATFATALGNGTATGTITMMMAPMTGWAKVFSTTNIAVYQSTDPTATKMYFRFDDTPTMSMRVIGYESMTAHSTGTNPFPTNIQVAGGGNWVKSTVATSVGCGWAVFADTKGIYFHNQPFIAASGAGAIAGTTRFFGDPIPYRTGSDPWCAMINYSVSAGQSSQYDNSVFNGGSSHQAFPRAYTGLGTAVLHLRTPYVGAVNGSSGTDALLGSFPSPIDGQLRLSKIHLYPATASAPRAELPGAYHAPHSFCFDSFKWADLVAGTGALSGKRFFVTNDANTTIASAPTTGNTGSGFIDVTGPWR